MALAGCGLLTGVRPFPNRTPPGTVLAYAQSYGGFVGGHAFVALTQDHVAWISCRFPLAGAPARRVGIVPEELVNRWTELLDRADLQSIPSDDGPGPTETPELWILFRGHVTYIQTFRHMRKTAEASPAGGPRSPAGSLRPDSTLAALTPIEHAFESLIAEHCPAAGKA